MGEIFRREVPSEVLTFTGERLTSQVGGQIEAEHIHRYFLARDLARGKDVLDVACGEGYGSAYLSQVAKRVIGVDLSEDAVAHASQNYGRPNVEYRIGSAFALPVDDHSVDLVVSFETIEHFYDHEQFLVEIKRVLRLGGIFLVSTPERDIYSPAGAAANPFHVRELTRTEFTSLLDRNFARHGVLAQRVMLGSLLSPENWPQSLGQASTYERRGDEHFEASHGLARATYLVALASDGDLPPVGPTYYIEAGYVVERTADVAWLQDQAGALRSEIERAEKELQTHGIYSERLAAEGEALRAELGRVQEHALRIEAEATRLVGEIEAQRSGLIQLISAADPSWVTVASGDSWINLIGAAQSILNTCVHQLQTAHADNAGIRQTVDAEVRVNSLRLAEVERHNAALLTSKLYLEDQISTSEATVARLESAVARLESEKLQASQEDEQRRSKSGALWRATVRRITSPVRLTKRTLKRIRKNSSRGN